MHIGAILPYASCSWHVRVTLWFVSTFVSGEASLPVARRHARSCLSRMLKILGIQCEDGLLVAIRRQKKERGEDG